MFEKCSSIAHTGWLKHLRRISAIVNPHGMPQPSAMAYRQIGGWVDAVCHLVEGQEEDGL